MFGGLYNINFTDYSGAAADLHFLYNEHWLTETAVNDYIYYRKGNWYVALVFGYTQNPFRFLCRYMNTAFPTKEKALVHASFYQRTAARNQGGALTINPHAFNICYN